MDNMLVNFVLAKSFQKTTFCLTSLVSDHRFCGACIVFFGIHLQCSILQSDHIFALLTYYQFFLLFYFEKGSKRSQNSEILHIWKSYLTLEIVKQDKCPKYSCQLIKHILCQTKYCVHSCS